MLFLITALSCEAEPLIDYFDLQKKESPHSFPLYQSESIHLIVSGVGRHNTAAAVGYLSGLFPISNHAWLNVGIAGHRDYEIGQGFFIHKCIDASSQTKYFPVFIKTTSSKSTSLITVDKPEKTFSSEHLYDMEASAFFAACSRFSTLELIHSFKVVSDNQKNSFEKLDKKIVSKLIFDQISPIEAMIKALKNLTTKLDTIHHFQEQDLTSFFFRWHFTATQKHVLKRLLQKWRAVELHKPIWDAILDKLPNPASVLEYLEKKINSTPLNF